MLNGKASDLQVHYSFALFNARAKPTPKVKPCSLKVKNRENHCTYTLQGEHAWVIIEIMIGASTLFKLGPFLSLIGTITNLNICKNAIQISLDSFWGKSPYKCSERWLCRKWPWTAIAIPSVTSSTTPSSCTVRSTIIPKEQNRVCFIKFLQRGNLMIFT